nr:probable receptor-like serine/threonine-protein kinase At5g57670 [Ipomoea batatas]
MNCLLYTQRTTLTREAYGTTMMKAILVEDYKSKSVIMVAESSGYGMNMVVIDLSQSQGTLGVPKVVIDLTQDNPDDEIQILEAIMPAQLRSSNKTTPKSVAMFLAARGWWSFITAARFCCLKCLIVGGTRYARLWCWLLKNSIAPSKAMDELSDTGTQDGSLKLRQSGGGDGDNNNRSAPDFVTPSLEEGEREQREGSRKNVEISIEEARPLDTNARGNGWKYDLNRIATIPLPWSYAGAKNSGPSPQGSGHRAVASASCHENLSFSLYCFQTRIIGLLRCLAIVAVLRTVIPRFRFRLRLDLDLAGFTPSGSDFQIVKLLQGDIETTKWARLQVNGAVAGSNAKLPPPFAANSMKGANTMDDDTFSHSNIHIPTWQRCGEWSRC